MASSKCSCHTLPWSPRSLPQSGLANNSPHVAFLGLSSPPLVRHCVYIAHIRVPQPKFPNQ